MTGSRVGAGVTIAGEIRGSDPLTVCGRVEGRIDTTDWVLIERSARVHADVAGSVVRVDGAVVGDVSGHERVEISAEASMQGDIISERILIADGARFSGSVDMNG